MAFLIPSIQFFFGFPRALFCFGIHLYAIFIIASSSPIYCLWKIKDWIHLAQDWDLWLTVVKMEINIQLCEFWEIICLREGLLAS